MSPLQKVKKNATKSLKHKIPLIFVSSEWSVVSSESHHSPLTTHHSPLTTDHSPLTFFWWDFVF